MLNTTHDCKLLKFPFFGKFVDKLTIIEGEKDVPFKIARTYTITGVASGVSRGSHGHQTLSQVVVCLAGEVCMTVDDGVQKNPIILNRPDQGLYVPPGLWTDTNYMTDNVVLMVVCDGPYDEAEYIRDYNDFLTFKEN